MNKMEYDKRKIYPADLRRMDSEAIQGEPQPKLQEQGIEEGDWFDYLPPNPVRAVKEGAKGLIKAAVKEGGKASSKSFLKNRKDMNEVEKQKDFKDFGAKLEGIKATLPQEKRFEISKEANDTSYQQVYNKYVKPTTPVKVADKYVSGPDVKGGTVTYDTASSNASIVNKERLKSLKQPFDRDIKFKINED